MKEYNLRESSLYKLFNEYPDEVIELVIQTFKSKSGLTINLLTKKYGPEFDGVNAEKLSYSDNERLKLLLKRFDSRLQCCAILLERGKTVSEIKHMFNKKSDEDTINMVNGIINSYKDSSYEDTLFIKLTKAQLLKKYNIEMYQLIKFVDTIEDKTERLGFIYTYGINRNELEDNEICKLLDIDKNTYKQNMKKSLNSLTLFIKNSELKKISKSEKSKISRTRTSEPKKKETKSKKAKPPIKSSFYEYFYKDNMTNEEKEAIREFVYNYVSKSKAAIKPYVIDLFGETLDKYNPDAYDPKNTVKLNILIRNIKTEIPENIMDLKNKKIRNSNFKNSFYEYFYEDDMTNEEKEVIRQYVYNYVLKSKAAIKPYVIDLFGETLDKYNPDAYDPKKTSKLNILIRNMKAEMPINIMELKNKKIYNSNFKNNFYEYFYEDDMTDEEKTSINKIVMNYMLKTRSNGKNVVIKLYGKDYDKLDPSIKIDSKERKDFRNIKTLIKLFIKDVKEKGNSNTSNQNLKTTFYEYFYKENMTEEEKEIIRQYVYKYVSNSTSAIKPYVIALYGKELDKYNPDAYDSKKTAKLNILIRNIKTQMPINIMELKNKKIHNSNFKNNFYEYFYEDDMTDEEKTSINKIVMNYMLRTRSKGKNVVIKLYGKDFDKLDPSIKIDNKEKRDLKNIILLIKLFIKAANEKGNNFKFNKRIKITFFEYFYKDGMTDEEKEIIEEYVRKYIATKRAAIKPYVIALYGKELDKYNPEVYDRSKTSKLNILIRTIKSEIPENIMDLKNKRVNNLEIKNNFYEYFYKDDMTDEEKEIIRKFVYNYVLTTRAVIKPYVIALYGKELDKYNPDVYDEKKTFNLHLLIKSIKKKLPLNIMALKDNIYNKNSFYEYFYKDDMTDEEKEIIRKYVYEYVSSTTSTVKIYVIALFGKELDKYNPEAYDTKKSPALNWLIQYIKGRIPENIIDLKNKKIRNLDIKNNFYEYFYKDDMTDEEKEIVRKYVYKYVSKSKAVIKPYVIALFGKELDKYNPDVYDSKKTVSLNSLIQSIRKQIPSNIKKLKNKRVNNQDVKNNYLNKSNENINIDNKDAFVEDKIEIIDLGINKDLVLQSGLFEIEYIDRKQQILDDKDLDYLNKIIIITFNILRNPEEVIEKLSISSQVFIDCYLNNYMYFDDDNSVLNYIICNSKVDDIKNLLTMIVNLEDVELTEKELQIIYLLLLGYRNNDINYDFISDVTGIDKKEIMNYQIMTKNNIVNELNYFLHLKYKQKV